MARRGRGRGRGGGTIPRIPVESSMLRSVGYDAGQRLLEAEFESRAVYAYVDVPECVYRELMAADSKGEYFNENIRDSYSCMRLS